jgi:hypothetical protein
MNLAEFFCLEAMLARHSIKPFAVLFEMIAAEQSLTVLHDDRAQSKACGRMSGHKGNRRRPKRRSDANGPEPYRTRFGTTRPD